jgi:2-keto-4-pentenoate hydratase/2-oxohepta-3-ene-1,7-dioic acid hydratase in catechol pathway
MGGFILSECFCKKIIIYNHFFRIFAKNKNNRNMKIICIGLNYHSHLVEIGKEKPQVPVFFFKPDTSLLLKNRPFFLPDFSQDMQYELELVVRINKVGKCIQKRFAHTYYNEVGLGIDFTASDLQQEYSKKGLPWEICKGFDNSAAVSDFLPLHTFNNIGNLNFHLLLNGNQVQAGNTSDMIFKIDEIIEYVSQYVTLKIGDLLFTGTPVGVGKVAINDHLQGFLEREKMLDFRIK